MRIKHTTLEKNCHCGNPCICEVTLQQSLFKFKIYLCKKCLQELYKQIGVLLVPTSPANFMSKNAKHSKIKQD